MSNLPKPSIRRAIQAKLQLAESILALQQTRLTERQRRVISHIEDSIRVIHEEHEREIASISEMSFRCGEAAARSSSSS